MRTFQGKYVAQGPRDYLLRFLVPKWSLQSNQQSLVSCLIIQPLLGWLSHSPQPTGGQESCLLPQMPWWPRCGGQVLSGGTVNSQELIPTLTLLSTLNSQRRCSPNRKSVTPSFASLLPVASLQLLHLAKGFIREKPRLCTKRSHTTLKYSDWTKDTKLVHYQTISLDGKTAQ